MVKVESRYKTAEDFNRLRGEKFLTKVKFFWRKGWTEIPVIMGSSILGVTGVCLIIWTMYYGSTRDLTPKYYRVPKIYRPDDPRIEKIRTTSSFD